MLAQVLNNAGLVIFGLAALYYGAEFLVRGGASLAARLGLPSLIIGLTLVAYGTSAPEFVVSLGAAIDGNMDISVGNIVGSNICNVALILGISSMFCPLPVNGTLLKRDMPVLLVSSVLFAVVFLLFKGVPRLCGLLFLAGCVLYTVYSVCYSIKENSRDVNENDAAGIKMPSIPMSIVLIAVGLALLPAGSRFFVRGSVNIAKMLHVSEAVIGLTLVAVGTSLPELATSVVAAFNKECDIAVGNVVGSNIFNILFIMGSVGSITPFAGRAAGVTAPDIAVFLGVIFLLMPMMITGRRITKREGAALLTCYVAYLAWLIISA